ncbi:hypothetical protein STEG23_001447, partial [Scotinomys teguina]
MARLASLHLRIHHVLCFISTNEQDGRRALSPSPDSTNDIPKALGTSTMCKTKALLALLFAFAFWFGAPRPPRGSTLPYSPRPSGIFDPTGISSVTANK